MEFFINNKNSIKLKGPLGRSEMWEHHNRGPNIPLKNLFEVSSDKSKIPLYHWPFPRADASLTTHFKHVSGEFYVAPFKNLKRTVFSVTKESWSIGENLEMEKM